MPQTGLYFRAPDKDYPDCPLQAWTQGEDEDTSAWVPIYDYPNDKASSELWLTAPSSMVTIGNGKLEGTTDDAAAKTKTWHWVEPEEHSTYLTSFIAGDFVELDDKAGDLPVAYYVPRGREKDARRTFGRTPEMIALDEDLLGQKSRGRSTRRRRSMVHAGAAWRTSRRRR